MHLTDVATVDDSVQDLRNLGLANGKPAVLVIVFKEPGANVIQTVDAVKAAVPKLQAALPHDIDIDLRLRQHGQHPRLAGRHGGDAGASPCCW